MVRRGDQDGCSPSDKAVARNAPARPRMAALGAIPRRAGDLVATHWRGSGPIGPRMGNVAILLLLNRPPARPGALTCRASGTIAEPCPQPGPYHPIGPGTSRTLKVRTKGGRP
jgi:hypothetical protein